MFGKRSGAYKDKDKKETALSTRRRYERLRPKSPAMEAYRILRTNVGFSNAVKKIKTLLITSSIMGEGKSTTVANLGIVFANTGTKTLILDMDMRKPAQHKIFGVKKEHGLTSILSGEVSLEEAIAKTDVENLYLLPCGVRPPNPSEIVNSQRMKDLLAELREKFDTVLIDSPPVVALTDAAIISTYSDAVILIVSSGTVEYSELDGAIMNLKRVNANLIGAVINNLKRVSNGYYYYYYYYTNYN